VIRCKHCSLEIVRSPDLSKQTKTEFYFHKPSGNVYCRNSNGMLLPTRAEPDESDQKPKV